MKTIETIFGEVIEVTNKTICVTMTDKQLSGWGRAEGKPINKYLSVKIQ